MIDQSTQLAQRIAQLERDAFFSRAEQQRDAARIATLEAQVIRLMGQASELSSPRLRIFPAEKGGDDYSYTEVVPSGTSLVTALDGRAATGSGAVNALMEFDPETHLFVAQVRDASGTSARFIPIRGGSAAASTASLASLNSYNGTTYTFTNLAVGTSGAMLAGATASGAYWPGNPVGAYTAAGTNGTVVQIQSNGTNGNTIITGVVTPVSLYTGNTNFVTFAAGIATGTHRGFADIVTIATAGTSAAQFRFQNAGATNQVLQRNPGGVFIMDYVKAH